MFKKRLKGLLAMVLAGSIALTALPMSASAGIIGGITVYNEDTSKELNYDNLYSDTLVSGNLNSNSLWGVYYNYSHHNSGEIIECGTIVESVSGDKLLGKIGDFDGRDLIDYSDVKISAQHKYIVTTEDPSTTSISIESVKTTSTFPLEISLSEYGFTASPLIDHCSCTAWYGVPELNSTIVSHSSLVESNVKSVTSSADSKEITVGMEAFAGLYSADIDTVAEDKAEYIFENGITILQLKPEYKTLSLPVKNAFLKQETDSDGADRHISVSKDSESPLDGDNDYFYLCYYDEVQKSFKISSSAKKYEKDVWDEINTWVTEDPNLDTNNLFLCRKVVVNVSGNGADSEFNTKDLLDYLIVNQGNYTTNQALLALFTAKPNSIWEVNPRFTENPSFYTYQKDAATSISDFLLEYPHEKRLNLFELSSIRVTALDPKTNGEIEWGYFIESKLLDENGEPRKISDHFNDLFSAVPQEAGKKYDTDGWQLWAGVTSCGGLYNFSKVELDKKPDSIGVTELNKMQNSIEFVYFPQVEIAPSLEVTAPVAGATPSTECKIIDKVGGYEVLNVEWSCGNTLLLENDKFEAGKEYTVKIELGPDEGLSFVASTPVTINGEEAAETSYYENIGLYAYQTFTTAPEKPSPEKPSNVKATPGDGNITLTWNAVKGAAKYKVMYRLSGTTEWAEQVTNDTSYNVTGLTNGKDYEFIVLAGNANGWSKWTDKDIVTATPCEYKGAVLKYGEVYEEVGTVADAFTRITKLNKPENEYIITVDTDLTEKALSFPKAAKSISLITTDDAVITFSGTSISTATDVIFNCDIIPQSAGKVIAVKAAAGKTLTINTAIESLGAVSGTKTSVLNVNADMTAASLATFKEVNVAESKTLTVTGKTTAVSTLNGTVKLPTAAAAATVTTVGNAEFILTDGDLAKATVNDVTEQLTITVVDAEGTEAALASGTTVLYSAKDISEKVTIANKTADSKTLNAFYYTKTKSIKAEWAEAVTLSYGGNARNFPNLELALAAITDSSTDYTVTLNTDVTAAALTLPKTAKSITIDGTGTLTTGSTSIAIPVDTAIGCNIIQSAGKTIALKAAAGKTLTINTAIESLGAVSGTKTSVLNVNADVTAASLATFKEVNVAESKTLTVTGKTTSVATLNGTVKLPTAAAAATVTTVGKAEFILTKGDLAKATVNDVTESLKITVVNADGAEAALASGTTVLYTAGKTDYTDKVTIANQTPAGLELTAFLYTKEIKAEYAGAVTLSYSETAKQFPNLELALAAITDSSTDYTVTLNTDVTAAALTLPKTAKSITINGTGTLTTGSTSIAIPVDTTIECNIIQSAGKAIALNVSAGKTLTINTAIENLGAVSGTKTSVLNVNADVTAASIATFGEVNVAESKTLTVTGKTTAVTTLNGAVKLPTAAAAATVTTVGKAEFILTKGDLAKATVNDVTESLKITVVNANGERVTLASGTTVLYTAGKTDYTDKVTIANQTPAGLELTAVLYTKEIKAECAADTSLVSVFDGTSNEQYQNITLALASIKDATKNYVLTLSDDISTEKINLPTKANSLTIKSDSDTVRTISLTGVTSLSARIPLTLENVGIESTKSFTISAANDLTLNNFVSNSISAVKGGSKFVLALGKTSPIDKISGFGTVNVTTDFTVGTTFTTTALYLGENAGITMPGTKSTVSTKTLNGANGSYIKFEQGFTPIKITGTTADSVTGSIKLKADGEISESTILFTTRIIGNGVFDVTEIQPAGATVDYTVAVISGKAYIRPIALDLNGTKYALWTDVVAAIEAAKESTADYTITLIDNYDVGGAIKLPKAGTYNSLMITSDSKTLSFTGNVISTGSLNIVNTSLDSAKNGVSAKYTVSAGKYRFSAENVDFNLASGLSATGDVTLKNVTLNGTVKAGVLTLNGTNTVLGTVTVTELNSAESGAVLNILNNTRGVLSVTKNGITAGSADITLRLVNADGSAAIAEEGAIIASTFKGGYDGQLKLSTENGIFNIVLTDKGKLVLESETLTSTDAENEDPDSEETDEDEDAAEEDEDTSEDDGSDEDEDTSEDDGSDEDEGTSEDESSDEDDGSSEGNENGDNSEGDETSEETSETDETGDEPVSDETVGDNSDIQQD